MAINKVVYDGDTLIDLTGDTAVASDVASGKTFHLADGTIATGTASGGGGGASNIVTGTFKGTTTGAAMNVEIPYTGSGYPISMSIRPADGYQSESSAYSLVQRYGFVEYANIKRTTETPTYSASTTRNQVVQVYAYKSSLQTASTLTAVAGQNVVVYAGADATSTATQVVRFKDAKTLSVFIASNSYGFIANIEYAYIIIYSE